MELATSTLETSGRNNLCFVGDIHGEFRSLVWDLTEHSKVTDSDVVVLGDFGMGFEKYAHWENLYAKVESKLENSNICIYAIRGNHDDPQYFQDGTFDFPRLKFLPDHTLIELAGYSIYPIGGANSVDRDLRLTEEQVKKGRKKLYWPGERPSRVDPDLLPYYSDIIISHDAPISFEPVCIRPENLAFDIWENVLSDRKYLEEIKDRIVTERWFFGHHHKPYSGTIGGVSYRCLGISEIYQLPPKYENPEARS